MKNTDLIGKKFGRWTLVHERERKGKYKRIFFCLCECGIMKSIAMESAVYGHTKSCGCLERELSAARLTKHGKRFTSEYNAWRTMKSRCYNSKNNRYMHYGARGIKVCEKWKNSFESFYADMGDKPTPGHSMDRINVHGNYEASNCRWATSAEQSRNKQKQNGY